MTTPTPASAAESPRELTIDDALQLAIKMHRTRRYEGAEELYRRILAAVPGHPDALHFLGVLRHHRGHTNEGIDLIREAVAAAPEYVDAFNNLGNLQQEAGRPEAAEAAFRRVLELQPDHVGAMNNLGVALKEQRRLDEAEQVLRKAVDLQPDSRDLHYNLGNVYRHMKRTDDAMRHLERAIDLDPHRADGYRSLGQMWYALNQPEQALKAYRRWHEAAPDDPGATHLIAACTGQDVPDRGDDRYVRELFDRFAASFDRKLRDNLKYQAPELLHAALAEELGDRAGRGELDVLDAGCGTGLCGALLRPHARRLTGVDLSPRMLERAKATGHYDAADEGELTAYIARHTAELDVIFSADTLCYFGSLEKVAGAAAQALRPGGLLAFTVEALTDDPESGSFRLEFSGRYSHARGYLQRVLDHAGLDVRRIDPAVLRNENNKPVHGHVVLARRSHA